MPQAGEYSFEIITNVKYADCIDEDASWEAQSCIVHWMVCLYSPVLGVWIVVMIDSMKSYSNLETVISMPELVYTLLFSYTEDHVNTLINISGIYSCWQTHLLGIGLLSRISSMSWYRNSIYLWCHSQNIYTNRVVFFHWQAKCMGVEILYSTRTVSIRCVRLWNHCSSITSSCKRL